MERAAFISYQNADKGVAGKLKKILNEVDISSFLAHEDIDVSEEWRLEILKQIGKAHIFIAILSAHYSQSDWCVQESGIASFRSQDMTVIPISLDGTIPMGFIGSFQSVKIDPDNLTIRDLIPGILKHDFNFGVQLIIDLVKESASYRIAEKNFELLRPHISKMDDNHVKTVLEYAASNSQVHDAFLCATRYLPELLRTHGHLLDRTIYTFLENACAQYG
jgi:hypothetical protein